MDNNDNVTPNPNLNNSREPQPAQHVSFRLPKDVTTRVQGHFFEFFAPYGPSLGHIHKNGVLHQRKVIFSQVSYEMQGVSRAKRPFFALESIIKD